MRPFVCNFYLTFECNDTCEFCRIWQEEPYKGFSPITLEEIKKYFVDLKKKKVPIINFTGGEPLVRDDIEEILRFSKRHGFFNILSTNGILFPEKSAKLKGFVDHLVVSLDSAKATEHNRIRGVNSYSQAIESLRSAKTLGMFPVINFTVTRDNISELPEMVDLATKLNVLLWVNPLYNCGGLEGFEKDSIDYIVRYNKRTNVAMNLASLKLVAEGGNNVKSPVCRAGSSTITILPDGAVVSPCIHVRKTSVKRERLAETFKAKELSIAATWHGLSKECQGCMDWTYLNPSFLHSFNRFTIPAIDSVWRLFWKEQKLRKGAAL